MNLAATIHQELDVYARIGKVTEQCVGVDDGRIFLMQGSKGGSVENFAGIMLAIWANPVSTGT